MDFVVEKTKNLLCVCVEKSLKDSSCLPRLVPLGGCLQMIMWSSETHPHTHTHTCMGLAELCFPPACVQRSVPGPACRGSWRCRAAGCRRSRTRPKHKKLWADACRRDCCCSPRYTRTLYTHTHTIYTPFFFVCTFCYKRPTHVKTRM